MAKYLTSSNNPNLKVIAQHEMGKPKQKSIMKLRNNFFRKNNIENQIYEIEQPDNPATKISKKQRTQYRKNTRTVLEERPKNWKN